MRFLLTKRVEHHWLKEPIVQQVYIDAVDRKAALKMLTIPTEHVYSITKNGLAVWRDHKDGEITLTLEEISCLK